MTPSALDHPLVRDYLRRLEHATAQMPADERHELRENITMHLREELATSSTDAEVRNTLATLGDPYDIVGAQSTSDGRRGRGAQEIIAVVLLLIGALIVPVVGWVVGVVLLWSSKAWTRGQKLLGTFVFPGGLGAVLFLWLIPVTLFTEVCTEVSDGDLVQVPAVGSGAVSVCAASGPPAWLVIPVAVLVALGPIVVAVYLLRAAGSPQGQAEIATSTADQAGVR
jgi:hypothetical protein